jgi:hypothetical protein
MRHLRLVLPALAFVVAGTWAYQSSACEKDKATAAAAGKSSTCTAQMAAQCTADMAATCKAKGAKSATSAASCSGAKAATATVAASSGCPYMNGAATASSDHCPHATSAAVTASTDGCTGSSAKTTAVVAGAGGSCSMGKTTVTAGGGSCSAHGQSGTSGGCDGHSVMALGFDNLEGQGTRTQVVPLKNGVMFVYTAETPGNVNAVQTALARRSERLAQIVASGDKAHLCADCKAIRGAMASGKMTREVVNIEGGALALMTSDDPTVVAKIHAMIENHRTMHVKT